RLPQTVLGDITEETHPLTAGGFESMGFIGAAAGALAVLGLLTAMRHRARWTALAMTASVAFGALCSLGPRTFAYRAMYRIVPGFDLARVPGRWMLLVVVGAAILAAFGVDQLDEGSVPDRRIVGTGALLTAVVAITWFGPFDRPSTGAVVWWTVAFAMVLGLVVASQHLARLGGAAMGLLVLLAAIELGVMSDHSFARGLTQPRPFTELGDDITTFLSHQPGRTLSLTDDRLSEPSYLVPGLRPNTNAAVGVASLDGYDGGTQVTTRWVEGVSALVDAKIDPELTLRSQLAIPISTSVSARLGVRWLLIDTNNRPLDVIAPDWGAPVRSRGTSVLLENPDWTAEARVMHRSTAAPTSSPSHALR
ncbi:MAG TPA: hypothetical protein VMY34_00215, partial [Acidimicrobiales bacterium]|nr:hypothetical protein [Acidimicrobiales bacterium]